MYSEWALQNALLFRKRVVDLRGFSRRLRFFVLPEIDIVVCGTLADCFFCSKRHCVAWEGAGGSQVFRRALSNFIMMKRMVFAGEASNKKWANQNQFLVN